MRTLVILNPAAGRGRGGKWGHRIASALQRHGWSPEIVATTRPGHGTELARRAMAERWSRVIAAGGDGTVHEVANGLLQAPRSATSHDSFPDFGVIPIGTGNDFARLVGMTARSLEENVSKLVSAHGTWFEVGRVRDEYFVNSLGVGFGAEVVRRSNAMKHLKGLALYLAAATRTIVSFDPVDLEVQTDDFGLSGPMTLVEVAVGRTAGGGFRLTPDADPTDEVLDVCLIRAIGPIDFIRKVHRVVRGTHGALPEVELRRATRVSIRSTAGVPLALHVDGEYRALDETEITIHVQPRRLRALVAR